jgi:mRNA interferase MazF
MVDEVPPPKVAPKVKAAPRIRQVYWCRLPVDAELPEFWKTRPVLIMSKSSTLHGKVTVLPFTTKSQPDNPHAHPLASPIDGTQAWVVCDHFMTVAVSRLSPPGQVVPRLSTVEFDKIKLLALKNLPY